MASFDFDVKSLTSSEGLATQAVNGIHRDIDASTQGKPLTTSRSASPMGNPQQMTVFSVAQILQGVPAYASPTEALGRYQAVVDSSFLLARDKTPMAAQMESGLVPGDVRQTLTAMEAAEKFQKGDEPPPPDGTTPADGAPVAPGAPVIFSQGAVSFDLIKAHPNIPYICDNFSGPAASGIIDPRILWVVKYLADNGCVLYITSGKRAAGGLTSSGNVSLHGSGKAVDFRGRGGGDSMVGEPWVTKVFQLLDSLTGDCRPYEVGFLPAFKGGPGCKWINDKNNHIHVGYKTAPPATLTGGVTQPPATASPTMQPISNVTPVAVTLATKLANQKPIVNLTPTHIDLQRRALAVVRAAIEADATWLPQWRNQAYVAMIESGWAESGWFNNPGGDASSAGIFQLLSMHGTLEQRMTPEFSAAWWVRNARGVPAKNGKGTAGDVAWQTERPATRYRYKYDTYRNQAVSDLAKHHGIDASAIDAL